MGDEYRAKILNLMKIKGPIIPVQAAKELNTSILMASAMLGEMSSQGLLKMSSLRFGGSPVYYIPGQEEQLYNFLSHLNEKDQRTVNLLKEKIVLRDSALEPLTRVSLRQVKDFAQPLDVTVGDQHEIFWKWHLAPDSRVEELIGKILNPEGKKEAEQPAPKPKQEAEVPKLAKQEIVKPAKQETLVEPAKALEKKPAKTEVQPADSFIEKIVGYFKANNIIILEQSLVKKNTEADFIIQLPTPVGELHYYCKAKGKKTISDDDLAQVFARGQMKKLPVLLLSTGALTKKAQAAIKGDFSSVTFKRISF